MPIQPNITWIQNIPFSTHNPSVDQPNMLINNNNNEIIWDVDHIGFNNGASLNSGTHSQVTLINQLGIPNTNQVGATVTYSKVVSGQTQDFETTDAGANQYQLTRFIDAEFAKFATNNAITKGVGGWTYLPGGLLLQYGTFNPANFNVNAFGTMTFPISFTSPPFLVMPTLISQSPTGSNQPHVISVMDGSVGATSFKYSVDSNTLSYTGFSWIAIGI